MHKYDPLMPIIDIMDKTEPALSFNADNDFDEWKSAVYAKLSELTGYDRFIKVDPEYKVEYTHESEDYTEIRFTMKTEASCVMPCHLFIPKKVEKPPLMVCLQGHGTGMHVSMGRVKYANDKKSIKGGRDFAVQALAHGMAALCVEQRGFGERKNDPDEKSPQCHVPAMAEILVSRTLIGARAWDISRALDVVAQEFTEIDSDNIYITGNSGGGTASYYTACLEPRIKALMPSCAVSSYRYSIAIMKHCVCNHIPHSREFFEMGDLACLIAPRPMVVVAGRYDKTFPLDGVLDAHEKISAIYKHLGCEQNAPLVIGEQGHQFYPELAWPKFMELVKG